MGEGVGMGHGKGAGTTDSAPVGPTGDAGPIKPGGTKTSSYGPEHPSGGGSDESD